MENIDIENAAKDFIAIMNQARESEKSYFSLTSPEILEAETERHISALERYGENYFLYGTKYLHATPSSALSHSYINEQKKEDNSWKYRQIFDVEDRFFRAEEYSRYFNLLSKRETTFQKLLDASDSYREALRVFYKKTISVSLDYRYKTRDLAPLALDTILDLITAKAINTWNQIKAGRIERYHELPKKEATLITSKAKDLLAAIEDSSYPIDNALKGHKFLERLRLLSDGSVNKYSTLSKAHIDSHYYRYRPHRKHSKAEREILIRELTSNYMWTIGASKLLKPSGEKTRTVVSRQFNHQQTKRKPINGVWHCREKPIIHPDVIINILGVWAVETLKRTTPAYQNRQTD